MASSTQNLEIFIHAALKKGVPKAEIEQCLLQAGWPADQIKNALGQFADISFAVPVPKPRPYLSAREAFQYLLLFAALYFSAYYLGSLLFSFVNLNFPDPAVESYRWRTLEEEIRLAASFLIITYPIFLFMSFRTQREATNNPAIRLSVVRRWLTYLTLFVAACFVIGDLVVLVYNALGGELTVRFCLKVLIVGVIAGLIFCFYLWDLRRDECDNAQSMNRSNFVKRMAATVSAVFLASLIGAFYVLESPSEQRLLRLDEQRLRDLSRIDDSIRRYIKNHNALPQSLVELKEAGAKEGRRRLPVDPDTEVSYEYEVLDEHSYQLCAVFSLPSSDDNNRTTYYSDWWRVHAAGKQCFKYTRETQCAEKRG